MARGIAEAPERTRRVSKKQLKLHEVTVKNRALGKLNNSVTYLTDDLFKEFEQKKNSAGIRYIELLERGKAIRGFKHLLERIKHKDPKAELVLTLGHTRKEKNRYFINYKEYTGQGHSRFLSLYREIGLDVSLVFLSTYFPSDFEPLKTVMPPSQLTKVERNLPEVFKTLRSKYKNQLTLIEQTSQMLEDLRNEKRRLRKNVNVLEELRAQSNALYYREKLSELRERLRKDYPETSGKYSWQKWIHDNNWIFGFNYGEPIPKRQVGFQNIPDFLFPSLDGFLDILEIKKPSDEVLVTDPSHAQSYVWTSQANRAIGQVITYIHEMESHQHEIREKINEEYFAKFGGPLFTIRPRAFILIGNSESWSNSKKQALRKLNYALHGIQVLTYNDLLQRGEHLVYLITQKI